MIRTEDGKRVDAGDVVFNYYDGKWGTIVEGSIDAHGWFDVRHEDGTRKTLNGERISSFDPKGSRPAAV